MRFSNYWNESVLFEDKRFSDWEQYQNRSPELKAAVEVLKKLEAVRGLEHEPKAYVVGGAVRDIVLGKDLPDDVDIATNVPIDEVEQMFDAYDIGKNKEFGIVVIKHGGYDFEVANFRQDGAYEDGRHPDDVKIVIDFKDDASRRDLTINAMAIDKDGNIIDYFDGTKDIKDKLIRTVGDPEKRFKEDYIRMLRAPRFAARFGFDVDPKTANAIRKHSAKLEEEPPPRLYKEIVKMAREEGSKFADAIIMMKDFGLLQHILPEVVKMDEFYHSLDHHPEGVYVERL